MKVKLLLIAILFSNVLFAEKLDIKEPKAFEPSAFTYNKMHEYFGLASVGLGLTAGIIGSAAQGNSDLHKLTGASAAYLGVASVASGFLIHFDDINPDYGIKDPDNLHILFSLLGAGLMLAAINNGDDVTTYNPYPHALFGALGTISMAIGISITW